MVIEGRQSQRLGVVWKANITRLNGEQLPGSTDNISQYGVNVILAKELVVGEPLKLQLVYRCSGQLQCFDLHASVVYTERLASNLGNAIGMRFIEFNPAYESHFKELQLALDELKSRRG